MATAAAPLGLHNATAALAKVRQYGAAGQHTRPMHSRRRSGPSHRCRGCKAAAAQRLSKGRPDPAPKGDGQPPRSRNAPNQRRRQQQWQLRRRQWQRNDCQRNQRNPAAPPRHGATALLLLPPGGSFGLGKHPRRLFAHALSCGPRRRALGTSNTFGRRATKMERNNPAPLPMQDVGRGKARSEAVGARLPGEGCSRANDASQPRPRSCAPRQGLPWRTAPSKRRANSA